MDIFQLHNNVLAEYRSYVSSFLNIADDRIRDRVQHALLHDDTICPEALVQLNAAYAWGPTVQALVQEGLLHPGCAPIFQNNGTSIRLYQHQEEAIRKAVAGEHFVVTSGTGSGKSLCYAIPTINHVLQQDLSEKKVRAIFVYPMNALINSQLKAMQDFLQAANETRITVERYTGQEDTDEKAALQMSPPHILLTNYKMLELILTRPQEDRFVSKKDSAIDFLILDELHTYRGRQGADVAMLVRRLRERCGNPNLRCIGTSATMATGASRAERRGAIAAYATRLFGVEMLEQNVVEETLRPLISEGGTPAIADVVAATTSPSPAGNWGDFSTNALAQWMERTFGIEEDPEGHLKRMRPISVKDGAAKLAEATGLSLESCDERLREMLLLGNTVETPDRNLTFAFKLHQFVGQKGAVSATLEAPDERLLTLDQQYFAPGGDDRLLYPLVFCRTCGQEYYVTRYNMERQTVIPEQFNPRKHEEDHIEGTVCGYTYIDTDDRWANDSDHLPEHLYTASGKSIQKRYKDLLPQHLWVQADGNIVDAGDDGAISCWFVPSPFMFCMSCGEVYKRKNTSEFAKLATLSSEGRSTATTLLCLSAISHMKQSDLPADTQKIMSFMDNVQDASLQAGHFNDFVVVGLVRTAICEVLRKHKIVTFDQIACLVVGKLGLELSDYASDEQLDPESPRGRDTAKTFTQLIEYRLYEDLRRGWRVVQPNLEQCGLLKIDYNGLAVLAAKADKWSASAVMSSLQSEKREHVLRVLLDEMRRQLAIDVPCLTEEYQGTLVKRTQDQLSERWAFDSTDGQISLQLGSRFVLPGGGAAKGRERHSLSNLSSFGKWLRKYVKKELDEAISGEDCDALIEEIVAGLSGWGLLRTSEEKSGGTPRRMAQIPASALMWLQGDGKPAVDLLRRHRIASDVFVEPEMKANTYFRDFYQRPVDNLRGTDGAEHTGNTDKDVREEREKLFGAGKLDALFCTPTMELGVDIRTLNAVHMRNLPPTPANYAQRSGRAGRAGQPALVLAYCSAQSGHDQYYFERRADLVAGSVVPPRIDITNQDLLQAHIQAIWLYYTGLSLGSTIPEEIVEKKHPTYELLPEVREQIALSEEKMAACLKHCQGVILACGQELEDAPWYEEKWLEETLKLAAESFDRAFDRWRALYRAAYTQLEAAQQQEREKWTASDAEDDGENPKVKRWEAERQLELLSGGHGTSFERDFEPYHYLSTEGFLPGYNFAALPVRAYMGTPRGGTFITRSRTVAIRDFGPQNTIYHEGSQYQVNRVVLPAQSSEERFRRARLCEHCGYLHIGDLLDNDLCAFCGCQFNGENSRLVNDLFEMPTVVARRRDRITCDEEERLRMGYDTSNYFKLAAGTDGRVDAQVFPSSQQQETEGAPLLQMIYAASADLWTVNRKWRNSDSDGYRLDVSTGRWLGQTTEPRKGHEIRERVQPYVVNTANSLLIYPTIPDDIEDDAIEIFLHTLQYALARGINAQYQVEASEVGSELIGDGEQRGILLHEAAEGGLGVLRRLVDEPHAIVNVAKNALDVMHFDPATGEDSKPPEDMEKGCAKACYECLLSYYNQRDHKLVDRHVVLDFMLELIASYTRRQTLERSYDEQYEWLVEQSDTQSDLERKFLAHLHDAGLNLPDGAQWEIKDVYVRPDFYYKSTHACIFCDGTPHDQPQTKAHDEEVRGQLKERGYRVVAIRYDEDMDEQIAQYPEIFGQGVTQ